MRYLTYFLEIVNRKSKKKWRRRVQRRILIQSADHPEIEFKVTCDVTEPVEFGKINGFYDVTCNFELGFRETGRSHEGAACNTPSFFGVFLTAFLINIVKYSIKDNFLSLSKNLRRGSKRVFPPYSNKAFNLSSDTFRQSKTSKELWHNFSVEIGWLCWDRAPLKHNQGERRVSPFPFSAKILDGSGGSSNVPSPERHKSAFLSRILTSSYFLSVSSAIRFASANCASRMATRSSSILVLFSRAFRILQITHQNC